MDGVARHRFSCKMNGFQRAQLSSRAGVAKVKPERCHATAVHKVVIGPVNQRPRARSAVRGQV